MRTRIIVSQGRVADRTGGALVGAQLTGNLFAAETGETPITIGTPETPRQDQWDVALKHAETTLAGLAEAVRGALGEGLVPLLATNTCAASIATLPLRPPTTPAPCSSGSTPTQIFTPQKPQNLATLAGWRSPQPAGYGKVVTADRLILNG